MGLLSWLRARRTVSPKRPWVRPEFLGIAALVGLVGGGLFVWSAVPSSDPGSGDAPQAETKEAYVGLVPSQIAGDGSCLGPCDPEELLGIWMSQHPDAEILEKTPQYYEGVLLGYELKYREPA